MAIGNHIMLQPWSSLFLRSQIYYSRLENIPVKYATTQKNTLGFHISPHKQFAELIFEAQAHSDQKGKIIGPKLKNVFKNIERF